MWGVAGIVVTGSVIAYIEVPYLVRKKLFRELLLFSALLSFGVTVSILEALRIQLPNPLDWITAIYKPISDTLFGMLK
jgi:hypothetical protein